MLNTQTSEYEKLHETALKAPSSSGVYLWRNSEETVIYVGKAKNLKNRLSSYFSAGRNIKTELLVSNAASIEYITTSNEYEAFLLENNLIKKYTPRYNIQLKDGKSYPVLKITNEEFPRLYKTRQVKRNDGAAYFGPFPDAGSLDTFIDTLYKVYPLRHCRSFKKREAPCMYYHIGRCKAPCCNKIDKQTYNEFIEEIKALLEGKGDETVNKLTSEMKKAAAALNFEKAARLRDGLRALTIMQNQNIVEDFESEDRDYIAHWREGELVTFCVLKIRSGKLLGRDNFRVESLNEDEELLEEFARSYYESKDSLPPKIFISEQDNTEFLEQWLNQLEGEVSPCAPTSLVATPSAVGVGSLPCRSVGQGVG
ncbi:excinuclease ABC subunit UvrC [Treponema sp.]|uniref:excinuclease ABC subunit UvrC n=1 Tax=Treponema sp. TaxID=166 RepID=UPI00389100DA